MDGQIDACMNIWLDAWLWIDGWMLSVWKSVWPSSLSALGPSFHLVNGWSYSIDKWMNGWMQMIFIKRWYTEMEAYLHCWGSMCNSNGQHACMSSCTGCYIGTTIGWFTICTFLRRSSSFRWHRWWLMLTLSQWWLLQQLLLHSLQLMLLNHNYWLVRNLYIFK